MLKKDGIKALVLSILLAGCTNHAKEEDVDAINTLKTWKGENIHLALDKLGAPDNVSLDENAPVNITGDASAAKKNSIYLWTGHHQINGELEAQRVGGNGHGTLLSQANAPSVNPTQSCYLKIWASPEGIIRKFHLHGKTMACKELADKINATQ